MFKEMIRWLGRLGRRSKPTESVAPVPAKSPKWHEVPFLKRKRPPKLSRTERKSGAENAFGEFLSPHDLRCLEICGCDLDVAFHGVDTLEDEVQP